MCVYTSMCVSILFEMGQLFPDLQVNVTLDADSPDSFMEFYVCALVV